MKKSAVLCRCGLIGNITINGNGACTSVAPTAILPPMAVSTFPVHQVANSQPTIFDSSLIPQYSGKLNGSNAFAIICQPKETVAICVPNCGMAVPIVITSHLPSLPLSFPYPLFSTLSLCSVILYSPSSPSTVLCWTTECVSFLLQLLI